MALCRQDGWTALFAAAVNGHAEVAQVLLEHGASERQDVVRWEYAGCAVGGPGQRRPGGVETDGAGGTLLCMHVTAGYVCLLQVGRTPFYAACANHREEVMQVLRPSWVGAGRSVSH